MVTFTFFSFAAFLCIPAASLTAAGSLLPLERSLYLCLALASAVGGAFLGQCLWPSALGRSPNAPALLLALFFAIAPAGLAAISHAFHHSAAARSFGAETLYTAAWAAVYAGVAALGGLLTRLHASKAYEGGGSAGQGSPTRGGGSPHAHVGGVRSSVALRAEAYERHQAAKRQGLEWLSGVGNTCTMAALVVCMLIHAKLLEGTARGVVAVAPLLLLLHPHTLPFRSLSSANRYAPVASAIALVLACAALAEVAARAGELGVASVPVARGLLLVGCSVPSLVLSCKFLWDFRLLSSIAFYATAPLPTVPLALSHARPIYDLGAAALALAATQWFVARSVRRAGAKGV